MSALAATSPKRLGSLPNAPTTREAGLSEHEVQTKDVDKWRTLIQKAGIQVRQ